MTLILTSSRNPSVRIRQFLKEFSKLFPKKKIKIVNRGKNSLSELFTIYNKAEIILIITSKQGNPYKIIGYKRDRNSEQFHWFIDLILKYVKLYFELEIQESEHSVNTMIKYSNIDAYLKENLSTIFANLNNGSISDSSQTNLIHFSKLESGFRLFYYSNTEINKKLNLEIRFDEIILEEKELDI